MATLIKRIADEATLDRAIAQGAEAAANGYEQYFVGQAVAYTVADEATTLLFARDGYKAALTFFAVTGNPRDGYWVRPGTYPTCN